MGNEHYKKTLCKNLKAIRRSKGLSGNALAKILNTSQAKISYIENGKGVLSAEDIAVLSRRLNVPVIEFYSGLTDVLDLTKTKSLTHQLAHFGATLLIKPAGVALEATPFEEVFASSLAFIEDDRLHKGFCTALIKQASDHEINVDRIFSIIGNNPFLIEKALEQAELCLEIISRLDKKKLKIHHRSVLQLEKISNVAKGLLETKAGSRQSNRQNVELEDLTHFVEDCLNVKR